MRYDQTKYVECSRRGNQNHKINEISVYYKSTNFGFILCSNIQTFMYNDKLTIA